MILSLLQKIGDVFLGALIGKGADKTLSGAHSHLVKKPRAEAKRKHIHGSRYRAWLWGKHRV